MCGLFGSKKGLKSSFNLDFTKTIRPHGLLTQSPFELEE